MRCGEVGFFGVLRRFQSLFCWKCLCEEENLFVTLLAKSFNPCFAGSASVSRHFSRTFSISTSFNPCFAGSASVSSAGQGTCCQSTCFNPCFAGSASVSYFSRSLPVCCSMFQSLFCWKCLCEFGWKAASALAKCFNPCFAGSASVRMAFGDKPLSVCVSILVLLEVPL